MKKSSSICVYESIFRRRRPFLLPRFLVQEREKGLFSIDDLQLTKCHDSLNDEINKWPWPRTGTPFDYILIALFFLLGSPLRMDSRVGIKCDLNVQRICPFVSIPKFFVSLSRERVCLCKELRLCFVPKRLSNFIKKRKTFKLF
jgi:hypothetical protein